MKRVLLTPAEVARVFRHENDNDGGLRWVYRAADTRGFLHGASRRFGRQLLFDARVIARIAGLDVDALLADETLNEELP